MGNLIHRLKLLEEKAVMVLPASPALVQVIDGERTHQQQHAYEAARLADQKVIEVQVIDCSIGDE